MKNQLDFKAQFFCYGGMSFTQCFASAYVHLEGYDEKYQRKCDKRVGGICNART